MKNQSTSSRWAPITEDDDIIERLLDYTLQDGTLESEKETEVCFPDGTRFKEQVSSLLYDYGEMAVKMLRVSSKGDGMESVICGYPTGSPIKGVAPIHMRFSIDEWDNLVEANALGSFDSGESLNFVLTNYFPNQERIRSLNEGDFHLIAIAYDWRERQDAGFNADEAMLRDWYLMADSEPIYNPDGTMNGDLFEAMRKAVLAPVVHAAPNCYNFVSPIGKIKKITAFGDCIIRTEMKLPINGKEVPISLYAPLGFYGRAPKAGSTLCGTIALHGIWVDAK